MAPHEPKRCPKSPRGSAELSLLVSRGDHEALGELYELWFDRLYAAARSLTRRDESFCLDVVQEAMLKVARTMRPMPTEEDVARWLMRIMHTTALDLLRGEARRTARHGRVRTGIAQKDDVNDVERRERIEWLRQGLENMDAHDHQLLWLRIALGRTLAAAGALAGLSGDAAHGRVRRALARLRRSAGEGEP